MTFIGICQKNHFMHEKIIQNFTSKRIVENRWTVLDKTDKIKIAYQIVCLFVLLLYVPSQQLWSLQDGQFT